ncbi:MAG TPA: ABC transporter permease [Isosphaeraceae bacterium]|jgi:ABC-2 type transport system permease protein/lipopolysaccharide transport system permease protein|nr:ABC transporter permease [Isosphaeraceae bacterium]
MSIRTAPSPPHTEFFPLPPSSHRRARWLAAILDDAHQLRRFWPVVQNLVAQDLRVRYQRSALGFLWTLLNPILMMITLTVVFSKLQPLDWKNYAIRLFAGMVPWILFSSILNDCANCILVNEALIRKIFLPKLIFPLNRVLVNLIIFVLSMGALFLMLVPLGAGITLPMVLLPVAIALFTAFAFGLGLIIATMNTFYRDCSHLINVILQAWYFATPILYSEELFKSSPWMLWLNPAYPFIRLFQDMISAGRWPNPITFAMAASIAAVTLGVGYAAFKCYEDKLVFRL